MFRTSYVAYRIKIIFVFNENVVNLLTYEDYILKLSSHKKIVIMPRVSSSRIPVSISRSNSVLSDISNSHAAVSTAARGNSSSEAGKENDKGKGRES